MKLFLVSLAAVLAAAADAKEPPAAPKLPAGVTADSLADPKEAARVADLLDKQYPAPQSEATRMLVAILRGLQMDGSNGWFGPATTRYTFDWLAARAGVDPKAKAVPVEKLRGPATLLDRLDRDGDGAVTPFDLDWSDRNPYVMQANAVTRLFRRADAAGDGKLTKDDLDAFFKAVAKGKESFTADDLRRAMIPRGPGGLNAGDAPTVTMLVRGLFAGEVGSMGEGPAVGDKAPDFALGVAGGKETVKLSDLLGRKPVVLSDLLGRKPVVLCFGNFTCGPFRAIYPDVEAIYDRFKDHATFVMVYVREAHPTDGWKMEQNTRAGVALAQPTTTEERGAACAQFRKKLNPGMTVLVDDITDPAGTAYSGMPARLYVIDANGKVAFKNGRGPFGFKPGEMEQALVMSILESEKAPQSAVPLPADAAAWAKLPKAAAGADAPLPNWAKAVVGHLPRTAAAMLELDAAHRTKSPLDPALRAKMRWAVAKANKCEYAQATALADLKRAAGDDAVKTLTGDSAKWPAEDREPLEFARLLTVAAPTITDDQFAGLRKTYGDKKVAAMVLLAAYGNFQDRLLLGLNVPLESGGPMAPVVVKFADGELQVAPILPAQTTPREMLKAGKAVVAPDAEWAKVSYEDLQVRLEKQRSRTPRLPVPTWESTRANLPPAAAARPTRIVWSLVCNGYAPELAVPWNVSTRTMWAESRQDRVFEESLFWVQTRSIQCNYCMGHCEMLLEVAGLDKAGVAARTKALAGADWSAFPPAEQVAYAYARKLSLTPWALTAADYAGLEKELGPAKAMYTFWWLCRGLYMTRISDGFQLPLERDNVFADHVPKK